MRKKVEDFFLWKWLLSIERFVMVFGCIAIVLTIAGGVVCRYILHINFAGSDELLVIMALWLYYIGGLYGNYEDSHIKADVLSVFIKKDTALYIINVIIKAISLITSIYIAVWAFQYLQFCLKIGGVTPVYKLPMLCSRLALIVGYMAPPIYNIYHLIIAVISKKPNNLEIGGNEA
jgi:TRAP-type C4-dicarboxylate transport system permease small subunit